MPRRIFAAKEPEVAETLIGRLPEGTTEVVVADAVVVDKRQSMARVEFIEPSLSAEAIEETLPLAHEKLAVLERELTAALLAGDTDAEALCRGKCRVARQLVGSLELIQSRIEA